MSLEKVYPYNGTKNRIRMGLSQIPSHEWILYENDFSKRIQHKKDLIDKDRHRVIRSTKESVAAQHELLAEIIKYIKNYQSDLFTVEGDSIICHTGDVIYKISKYESSPLELISYLAPDDFCILDRYADDYRLSAASICSPTFWELGEKIGHPMKFVHAPIKNLEESIGRMIRHFFAHLNTSDYFQRSNWFLTTSDDWALYKDDYKDHSDIDELSVAKIDNKLFLRCERQTFRKLLQSENIIFGIKIYLAPLNIVEKNLSIAKDLLISIETMSEEQKSSLGIDIYEEVLLDYLRALL